MCIRDRGTPGLGVREEHALVGGEDLRRLGHEVHAAEDDLAVRRGRGDPGQVERVADVVGDVLDLRHLVVVGDDQGVPLLGEPTHLVRPCLLYTSRCV